MESRPIGRILTTIDILAASPLFRGLPPEQLAAVQAITLKKSYGRGETVFSEGDGGAGFYLVADGKVKIFKLSPAGKEHILHIFGPGEPFGEVAVFHGQPFPANAETLAPSNLLYFPRADFARLITDSAIAMNLLAVMALRLRRFASQIENLSLKEVPSRLASYLLYLAEKQDDRSQVCLDIAKGQLASLLGTSPETLSRIFAKMTEEGLIEVRGRIIGLKDFSGLAEKGEE
ncbi:MAG: Crp/Fnr family transcriptional regulator [Desulfobulbaceae bacterium]|jgi:CRP/FNR family transcriptional regulator|nr:Crp/Fnr family transcriptional regulator [Desulfobulbaceae bacterium]